MTEAQLKKILANPFASNALDVLDKADRIDTDLKYDASLVDMANTYYGEENNADILFLIDKSLKTYSSKWGGTHEAVLQDFEIQLKEDEKKGDLASL